MPASARGDGHVDPGVADRLDGLDVVPVPVGLDHLARRRGPGTARAACSCSLAASISTASPVARHRTM